ncbi:MAG TPA: molecular chaperone TorD family protein [Burkholderiaceae bacterium]|nr:molecular chaperone TorD family protein [Burkholderiaceae bacterium]
MPEAHRAPRIEAADLLLCLAAAFLPPRAALSGRAWCEALAADLDELAADLDLDATFAVHSLRGFAASAEADEDWLVQYSRLFLVPPVAIALNTGVYLEGTLGGASSQMLTQCYAAAGFERREDFRDLPDHVAMQLEFLAALFDRAGGGDSDAAAMAQEFHESFLCHWLEPLRAACERAAQRHTAASVYASLVAFLATALGHLL